MRSFIDGHGGSSSNGLIQEELRNGFAKRYAYKRTRNNGVRKKPQGKNLRFWSAN